MRRNEFPYLRSVTYLNNAFTSLTPRSVVETISQFYLSLRSSPTGRNHRVNDMIAESYRFYATFLGSSSHNNIVFTKGCTEAINYGAHALNIDWTSRDSIVVSESEYASNALPWLRLRKRGVEVRRARTVDGRIDLDHLSSIVNNSTRLVAANHVSNLYGCVNPIAEIAAIAHSAGSLLLVDGAQAASYIPICIADLGADLYAVSGHKACGPTGSGLLLLEGRAVPLVQPLFIGDAGVHFGHGGKYEFKSDYSRFFGGVSDTASILGLAASFRFLESTGIEAITEKVSALTRACSIKLRELPVRVISHPDSIALVTFSAYDDAKNEALWRQLDQTGIMIQLLDLREFPLLTRGFGTGTLLRCSFHFYNDEADLDRFICTLKEVLCV